MTIFIWALGLVFLLGPAILWMLFRETEQGAGMRHY